jgi:AAHS family benzoate transporter-like MFS transporter
MRSINPSEVMIHSKFGRFHLMVLFWCAFCIIFDGYDLTMYGVVLPVLMNEWNLTPIQAGAIGSYALFGMMFGAFIFSPLADKIGRKKVLVICIAIFSLMTILTVFSKGPIEFGILRFIAGLGLGGCLPNVISLMTEYSPKPIRALLVAIMYCGYSVGGIMVTFFGMYIMPEFGWRPLFWIGGIPLLFLPFFIKYFPESIGFYVLRKQKTKLCTILNKVDPGGKYGIEDEFRLEEEKSGDKRSPVKKLFEDKRALSTVMFWISCFCCLLLVYGLNTWLPKLMLTAGYGLGSSLSFMLTLNIGAILGSVIGGWMADKVGSKKVLIVFYLIGALCFVCLGFNTNVIFLYFLIGIGGACSIGTQNIANPYITEYYPKEIRATGIGWALGAGRIGGILGPTLGGVLLSLNLPIKVNFLVFAIPCILGAIAIFILQDKFGSFDQKEMSQDVNLTMEHKGTI